MTMQPLEDIVSRELEAEMKDHVVTSCMQGLFMPYNTVSKSHGLLFTFNNNTMLEVQHIRAAVKPLSLQSRLKNDLKLSHRHTRENSK